MRTETLIKALSKSSNLFERQVTVRLNGEKYRVSHIEHKEHQDVIVICLDDDD